MTAPELHVESIAEALLQQSPACHWTIDRELRFQQAFGRSTGVFGRQPHDLIGNTVLSVVPDSQAGDWQHRMARVFAGEVLELREVESGGRTYSVVLFPLRSPAGEIVLAGGTALDTTAAATAQRELRDTALTVLRAQDLERTRIARFLHDEVGQCLSATGLQLDLLRMDLESAVPSISERTRDVQQMLDRVMERVREYSYELNPATVERVGLPTALDRFAGRVRRDFAGTLRLMADPSVRVDPALASALFKIAQEAVNNAVQHSGASHIEVYWKSTPSGPTLEVSDNGKGFDSAEVARARRGLGLSIMRSYAAESDLQLAVASSRDHGTTVRATCSHKPANQ